MLFFLIILSAVAICLGIINFMVFLEEREIDYLHEMAIMEDKHRKDQGVKDNEK